MLAGDFQRKLRQLNPRLKIWCGDDAARPAGIFHVVNSEYVEICGIDKNIVPEFTVFNEQGLIVKGGWRRALKILLIKRLIDKDKAEKVFSFTFERKRHGYRPVVKNPPLMQMKGEW